MLTATIETPVVETNLKTFCRLLGAATLHADRILKARLRKCVGRPDSQ